MTEPDTSNYWKIYDQYYDLTEYVERHPGGNVAILLGKGRDCTTMFEQYHIMNNNHYAILDKYRVNKSDKPISEIRKKNVFHEDIKQMVRDHIKDNNTHHKMQNYMILITTLCGVSNIFLLYLWFQGYWASIILLPIIHFLFSVNTSHDAAHFAVSKYPIVNRIVSYTSFPFLYNVSGWYIEHNISHHPNTNLEDDVDLYHTSPFSRFSNYEPYKFWYKYQKLLLVPYMTIALIWLTVLNPLLLIVNSINKNIDLKYSKVENKHHITKYLIIESIIQILFTVLLIVYPFIMFSGIKSILFGIVPWIISSIIFMIITQVSHNQKEAHTNLNKDNWAINQVQTSVDYSQDSKVVAFLTGALNMQSLHHIIPCVNSSLYIDLYPKFRKICEKHNIILKEKKNIYEALKGFYNWIVFLSKNHTE